MWARAMFREDFVRWETETSAKSVLSLRYVGLLYVRVGATMDQPRPLLWSTRPSKSMRAGGERGTQPPEDDVYHFVLGAVKVDRRPPDGRVRGGTAYIVVVV